MTDYEDRIEKLSKDNAEWEISYQDLDNTLWKWYDTKFPEDKEEEDEEYYEC